MPKSLLSDSLPTMESSYCDEDEYRQQLANFLFDLSDESIFDIEDNKKIITSSGRNIFEAHSEENDTMYPRNAYADYGNLIPFHLSNSNSILSPKTKNDLDKFFEQVKSQNISHITAVINKVTKDSATDRIEERDCYNYFLQNSYTTPGGRTVTCSKFDPNALINPNDQDTEFSSAFSFEITIKHNDSSYTLEGDVLPTFDGCPIEVGLRVEIKKLFKCIKAKASKNNTATHCHAGQQRTGHFEYIYHLFLGYLLDKNFQNATNDFIDDDNDEQKRKESGLFLRDVFKDVFKYLRTFSPFFVGNEEQALGAIENFIHLVQEKYTLDFFDVSRFKELEGLYSKDPAIRNGILEKASDFVDQQCGKNAKYSFSY